MTDNVLLSISGLQDESGDDGAVELVTRAGYRREDDVHYIEYEEPADEDNPSAGINKCKLILSNGMAEIIKEGCVGTHLVFEAGKRHETAYETGYGSLIVTIRTGSVEMIQEQDSIDVCIRYSLDINYSHVSECCVRIFAKSISCQ